MKMLRHFSMKNYTFILVLLFYPFLNAGYLLAQEEDPVAELVRGKVMKVLPDSTFVSAAYLKVTLHSAPEFECGLRPIQTTFTRADGFYFFEKVSFGRYIIAIWSSSNGLIKRYKIDVSKTRHDAPVIYLSSSAQAVKNKIERVLEKHRIEQRHVKSLENEAFQGKLRIYVGDIHMKGPNPVLVFRTKPEYDSKVLAKDKIRYEGMVSLLQSEDIILQAKLKEHERAAFCFDDEKFILEITKLRWTFFATDRLDFAIIKEE